MQKDAAQQGGSGLHFQLHPLVLINISDHHTRTKLNTPNSPPLLRVVGCLLGEQNGRVVDISNSFELKLDGDSVNDAFLQKKMEQYKQTFPKLDVMGWYATGAMPTDLDKDMQKKMLDINESPLLLVLNPDPEAAATDLPVTLYETELHVLEGIPTMTFVKTAYTIETSEAERIGVDQVVKILPTGATNAAIQMSGHMSSMQAAVQMLVTRIETLYDLLKKMQSGEIPFNHRIARQIAALTQRLPATDTSDGKHLTQEKSDALLAVLLAGLTKGVSQANDVVDKHLTAYERSSTGGGGGGTKRMGRAPITAPMY